MSFTVVPTPTVILSPSGPIQNATIGSNLVINCMVSTVSGVESSSVMISWMGPGGGSFINDSRVTISPTTFSGNNYTSILLITYLLEENVDSYTCNVMILETVGSQSVELGPLTRKLEIYCCHRQLNIHVVLTFSNNAAFRYST